MTMMNNNPVPDDDGILLQARTTLLQQLPRWGAVLRHSEPEPAGERIILQSASGVEHLVIIRILNLDKARSLKITQKEFNYESRADSWILLALYMQGMNVLCYLVPTTVFAAAAANDMFVCNTQPPVFRHLSNWEIRVYGKAVPELSRYALESVATL